MIPDPWTQPEIDALLERGDVDDLAMAASVAFWTSIYGTPSILAAYTVAAIWGVGNETIKLMGELPHGLSDGTPFQETFIKVLAYSSAPTGLTAFALMLWGLRVGNDATQ